MNRKTLKWIEDATTRMERENINAKRRVAYAKNLQKKGMNAFIRNGFVVVSALAITSITVGNFFANNIVTLRSPIVIESRNSDFHSPISVVSAQETKKHSVETVKTEKEIVYAQPFGEILWRIYQLETQRGKTDWCRLNGKGWGGFGVKVDNQIHCYESFSKAAERANYWFMQLYESRTLDQALCKWSGRGEVDSCDYAYNYQFVK